MAKGLHEYLRGLADQIEADEKADRDAAAADKIAELEQLATANRAELSTEDRELLAWARNLKVELDAEDDDDEKPAAKPKPKPAAADDDGEKPKANTRPGRKSGQAYDFTVDGDGQVVRDGLAHIYSGPNEDDEVEIPAPAEDAA